MRPHPRSSITRKPLAGFSLIELSIVIAIMSVVSVFGLEAAANFINRSAGSLTKERLVVVDQAVASFFRVYGRLPCPANKALAPTAPSTYGTEDCTLGVLSGTTIGGGAMSGAVPYRTLNLPYSYSIDGFLNKFAYLVTKNLTVAGIGTTANGQSTATTFGNVTNGTAGIEVRSGVLQEPCNTAKCQKLADPSLTPGQGAAYFIFSHGADKRGAVNAWGVNLEPCVLTAGTEGIRPDSQNCVFGDSSVRAMMTPNNLGYNVFYDNRYNAGMNNVSYFDDYVIWRPKTKL